MNKNLQLGLDSHFILTNGLEQFLDFNFESSYSITLFQFSQFHLKTISRKKFVKINLFDDLFDIYRNYSS